MRRLTRWTHGVQSRFRASRCWDTVIVISNPSGFSDFREMTDRLFFMFCLLCTQFGDLCPTWYRFGVNDEQENGRSVSKSRSVSCQVPGGFDRDATVVTVVYKYNTTTHTFFAFYFLQFRLLAVSSWATSLVLVILLSPYEPIPRFSHVSCNCISLFTYRSDLAFSKIIPLSLRRTSIHRLERVTTQ